MTPSMIISPSSLLRWAVSTCQARPRGVGAKWRAGGFGVVSDRFAPQVLIEQYIPQYL